MISHILDFIVTLAALVAILDYFGIKPKRPLWGLLMPLSKNWKLGIMLMLVVSSLAMSGYGFYRALRPKVVEKTVTVTVEKPVEKFVKADCPKPDPSAKSSRKPAKETSDNSVHIEKGASVDQASQGDCSPNMIGGANTVTCGPLPLKLDYSFHTLLSNETPTFGFDRSKCPIVTHMRIVPNQSVPPPIIVALDFDQPVTQIGTTIEGVAGLMGGGQFSVGRHAISSPISAPGIGPHNPLIVEVCSATLVKLTEEPRLVN